MSETLANLLHETRSFPPPAELADEAERHGSTPTRPRGADRLGFWERQANRLHWHKPWDQVLDWSNPPFAKWFVGGELNVAYNCLDRHVEAGHGDRVAIHWEGEPGDTRTITYADLHRRGLPGGQRADSRSACSRGDRVAIYLPMIPEAAVAMLACARIGATHSVVFGGFSADALAGRIQDAGRQARHHRRRRLPARRAVARSSRPSTRRSPQCPTVEQRARGAPHRPGRRLDRGPRRVVARHGRHRAARSTRRSRSTPSTRCSSCTPRARPPSRRASCTPPAAT